MKKIIDVKSDKDYKKFISKLFIYKHLSFIQFDSKSKKTDVICNALNIKSRKERIRYIYDYVCTLLDYDMEKSNICDFKENKCFVQRNSCTKNSNGCCLTCQYLQNGKCITSNLTCKLFYCPKVRKKYSTKKMKDINILKLLSIRQRIILKIDFYSSKEEVLNDLLSRSLIIPMIKLLRRSDKVTIKK